MLADKERLNAWNTTRFLPKCEACKKYLLYPFNKEELTCLNCELTVKFTTSNYAEQVYYRIHNLISKHEKIKGGNQSEEKEESKAKEEEVGKVNA